MPGAFSGIVLVWRAVAVSALDTGIVAERAKNVQAKPTVVKIVKTRDVVIDKAPKSRRVTKFEVAVAERAKNVRAKPATANTAEKRNVMIDEAPKSNSLAKFDLVVIHTVGI
jgi:hypothetical protein